MQELLEKTRDMNKLILDSLVSAVDFNCVAKVLSKNIKASVYIINAQGKILGYAYLEGWVCDFMREIVEGNGEFPAEYNESLMKINDTTANFGTQIGDSCLFGMESCDFKDKRTALIPISGPGSRVGTLIMARFGKRFNDEDLLLGEYGATLVALAIIRTKSRKAEEEARKRATVQVALDTLSFSELDAIRHIFEELGGDEGLLVASKIADRVGITRSVIVNALRKFESAGVIESKSLGMKGTYIHVLNDYLFDELDKLVKCKKMPIMKA
ncbi:MAG: GTP-sensing pleiotropic transcriptional regulator CodY [Desulfotomaculaceae bacterium]|nr:GTP-sensing pleiotropic transcriptional regulator CodY [Desulfotomaculaceae bacterium]